ncbi:chemotaxis protein CheC [Cytobacillus kochii]|uniref:chemotaxis protein CheC n=1 Tax=Cytobacillus kochii TaxID=859143 RepID=UPI001CD66ED9|nr:chemotaxis protein CheC [Cytobacillus kochii]MCA1028491.1 chemotaxis protein CheC [Cytobacillus kochii]MCM3321687.1 chemotaxis protein CheC [Cytobacillus kochii]MCM3343479.1 chemotaxis protein CheC [Cytobacillus kochii]
MADSYSINDRHHLPKFIDMLKEVANIGAGNAATALSSLLDKKVNMHVPSVHIYTYQEVVEANGNDENVTVGGLSQVSGSLSSQLLLLLSYQNVERWIADLLQSQNEMFSSLYDHMEQSALAELMNMLTGAYASALGDFFEEPLFCSLPAISIDMSAALISDACITQSYDYDELLVIQTSMEIVEESKEELCHLLIFLDNHSLSEILKRCDG